MENCILYSNQKEELVMNPFTPNLEQDQVVEMMQVDLIRVPQAVNHPSIYDPSYESAFSLIPSLSLAVDTVSQRGFKIDFFIDEENNQINVRFAVNQLRSAQSSHNQHQRDVSFMWISAYYTSILHNHGLEELQKIWLDAIEATEILESRPRNGVLQQALKDLKVLDGVVCSFCVTEGLEPCFYALPHPISRIMENHIRNAHSMSLAKSSSSAYSLASKCEKVYIQRLTEQTLSPYFGVVLDTTFATSVDAAQDLFSKLYAIEYLSASTTVIPLVAEIDSKFVNGLEKKLQWNYKCKKIDPEERKQLFYITPSMQEKLMTVTTAYLSLIRSDIADFGVNGLQELETMQVTQSDLSEMRYQKHWISFLSFVMSASASGLDWIQHCLTDKVKTCSMNLSNALYVELTDANTREVFIISP
jgi:hypothetical protein